MINLLFIVIILEGFTVLAAELLAIRQLTPFVGSGTDSVSIIIAAVLMPLAFGYHAGGQFKPGFHNGKYYSIRKKLTNNILISLCFWLIGTSYFALALIFSMLYEADITNRLVLTTLYCGIFLVYPVFLLGQTIPLVSNYFSKQRLSEVTGFMLFFSTLGSFLGSVFTTLILMALIGVNYTATIILAVLGILIILLSKNKTNERVIIAVVLVGFGAYLNSGMMMDTFKIVENNQYSTIQIYENDEGTHMVMNNNSSSMVTHDGKPHDYIQTAEKLTLAHIQDDTKPAKNILVIGAGGFTYGMDDDHNHFDFVDIDPSLKRISEDFLLPKAVSKNKEFHPMPARGYLSSTDKIYDVIFLDAYSGDLTIPEHLVTVEFFKQIKSKLAPDGIVISNFILSPNFSSTMSQKLDNTFSAVFPKYSRLIVNPTPNFWENATHYAENIIFVYKNLSYLNTKEVYSDLKNTVFYDKPQSKEAFGYDLEKKAKEEASEK